MVYGVTFRGTAYMLLAAFVTAVIDGPALYIIGFANHDDHYLIEGLTLLIQNAIPVIIVLSVGVMVIGNAINRRQGVA